MGLSGGVFTRTDGVRSGSDVFAQQQAAAVAPTAALLDTEAQDMATALSLALYRDGQATATAAQPMGGFNHTNVGVATALTHYARASQVQDGSLKYAAASGTNTITATLAPAPAAYTNGMVVYLKVAATNTGAVTVNLNSIGAKDLVMLDGSALSAGELVINHIAVIVYFSGADDFYLINPCVGHQRNNVYNRARNAAGAANVNTWKVNATDQLETATALVLSGLTASRPVDLSASNVVQTPTAATFRSTHGIAASGSNSDITALTGVALQSYTPAVTASGSMTVSSLANNQGVYVRLGPFIFFSVSATFTLGGTASTEVRVDEPVAGTADSTPCAFACSADENGTAVSNARFRYTGSHFVVFKPAGANWTLGANAAVNIQGIYMTA